MRMGYWRPATCVITVGLALFAGGCGANSSAELSSPPAAPHSVALTWTASTASDVSGYNVYRGSASGGPYTLLNSSTVSGTTYTDTTVQPGQTYYYVSTAVDSSDQESAYSNETQAAVPSP